MAKRSSHASRFFKIVSYLIFHFCMFIGLLAIGQLQSGGFILLYILSWYIINYVFFSNRDPADFENN
jgi:amino acid permease